MGCGSSVSSLQSPEVREVPPPMPPLVDSPQLQPPEPVVEINTPKAHDAPPPPREETPDFSVPDGHLAIFDYSSWPYKIVGSAPPCSRPSIFNELGDCYEDLPLSGRGQRNVTDPCEWSLSVKEWKELINKFKATPTWMALVKARGESYNICLRDVVDHFIKPLTKGTGSSLALLVNSRYEHEPAHCMISHSWDASVDETYEAIDASILDDVHIFFCAFSLYQNGADHPDALTIGEQLTLDPFGSIIKSKPSEGMYVIFTTLADVYDRIWVVYEADEANAAGISITGLFDKRKYTLEALAELNASEVSTRTAKASNDSDRRMIESLIEERGGYDQLDARIKKLKFEMKGKLMLSAAGKGDITLVDSFLKDGHNREIADEIGNTPLSLASRENHISMMKLLLAAGAHVDAANRDGWTPLILAARGGNLEAVQLLLDSGANRDIKNKVTSILTIRVHFPSD